MANITTDRISLPHDDRLEAFAGAVREFKDVLDQDEHKAAEMRKQQELQKFLQDPMGYGIEMQRASGTRALLQRQGNRPSPVRAGLWK
jgi:Sec-independent protein translocase protein TatA